MFKLFEKFRKKPPVTFPLSNINTIIREGVNLFSDELIIIDEKVSVNLFCAERIAVEQNGLIYGDINSKTCTISGVVQGDVFAACKLEIKSSAKIKGNIKSPVLNIEPGAVINGLITIAGDKNKLIELLDKIKKFSTGDYAKARSAANLPLLQSTAKILGQEKKTELLSVQQVEVAVGPKAAPIVVNGEKKGPAPNVEIKAATSAGRPHLNGQASHQQAKEIKAAEAPKPTMVEVKDTERPARPANDETPVKKERVEDNKPPEATDKPPEQDVNRWW